MLGTVNVAVQVPFEATVMLELPMLTAVPLKVTPLLRLIVAPEVKPVPEIVTVVLLLPVVGERVIVATTENVAVSDAPEESVALTTFEPYEEFGTVNVADQVPVDEILALLLPILTAVPLKVTPVLWSIRPPPVYPVPETVTEVPTPPLDVETVRLAVTVNVAVADTLEESVAVTPSAPEEALGTVNVADQVPLDATRMLLLPMLTAVPANTTPPLWLIVALAVKPVPEMVTVVPTLPLEGESVTTAMVGRADASLDADEFPAALTAWTSK